MSHENKFRGRDYAENKISVQTKFDSPPLSDLLTLRSKDPKV